MGIGTGTGVPDHKLHVNLGTGESATIGSSLTASGNQAIAFGYRSEASNDYATAMGQNTDATGVASTAMGDSTDATGTGSTAMGRSSKATGDYSTAMGWFTEAAGDNSTAMGDNTEATGDDSTAMGWNTQAVSENSTAMGRRIIVGTTPTDAQYSFGIGLKDYSYLDAPVISDPSVMAIMGGNLGINTVSPDYRFVVKLESGDKGVTIGGGDTSFPITAEGNYSLATGYGSTASGLNSLAMGAVASASGDYSTAIGWYADANEDDSIAMGYEAFASGNLSVAIGFAARATGPASMALGTRTKASGTYATAMGESATASNSFSTAMGHDTLASGYESTAMGNTTIASGGSSTAMGEETEASGSTSTAMGEGTVASGTRSTAMGDSTEASGTNSTAMGNSTEAIGANSTAMGYDSVAVGLSSTAMGGNTRAESDYSTAIGRALDVGTNLTNAQYSVGIGLDTTERDIVTPNVMAIMGGNVGIGALAPRNDLHVAGEVLLETSGNTCTTSIEGTIRYVNGSNLFQLCYCFNTACDWHEISHSAKKEGRGNADGEAGQQSLPGANGENGADGQDGASSASAANGYPNAFSSKTGRNTARYRDAAQAESSYEFESNGHWQFDEEEEGIFYSGGEVRVGTEDEPERMIVWGELESFENFTAYEDALFHGRVGIGTDNPGFDLDVRGDGRFTGDLEVEGDA